MEKIEKDIHNRRVVPLVMLDGNMEALLANQIPVNGISLRYITHPSANGPCVVLCVSMTEEEKKLALTMGFTTASNQERE